ncbi:MAG: ABC transporter permease [Micropruina sp.]|uniref:ABC transporter permease n=1 Tax=Micropruina sp. TaxID=2737536 RepID=UPI0039E4631C
MNPSRVLRHAAMELRMLLRNGEQLLLAFAIPLGLLIGGMAWGTGFGLDLATFPASVIAVATWSTAFTAVAVATGFERRYGVLERLVATPLTRADLIAGKALAATALVAIQAVLLVPVGLACGWRPVWTAAGSFGALIATVLAIAAFAGLGLLLAGTLKAEVTLALANLIYLAGLAVGGLIADQPPWLPTAALGAALRAAAEGAFAPLALLVLAAWAAVLTQIARKAFRWTS